jgi:hypothetical protein
MLLDSIFTKLALCLIKHSPKHDDLHGGVDVLLHLLGILSIGCDVSFTLRLLYPVVNWLGRRAVVDAEGSEDSATGNWTQISWSLVRSHCTDWATSVPAPFRESVINKGKVCWVLECVWSVCNVSLHAWYRIEFCVSLCQMVQRLLCWLMK